MLVLAASATVGALSAVHRGTTAPHLRLLGFLGLGQLLGHIALSIGGTHAHAAVPAAPMLTAHVLAALLCAALILLSEQLCQVLGSVLRHSAGTGGWMLGRDGAGVPAYRFALITEVLASGTGNRGPPVVSSPPDRSPRGAARSGVPATLLHRRCPLQPRLPCVLDATPVKNVSH